MPTSAWAKWPGRDPLKKAARQPPPCNRQPPWANGPTLNPQACSFDSAFGFPCPSWGAFFPGGVSVLGLPPGASRSEAALCNAGAGPRGLPGLQGNLAGREGSSAAAHKGSRTPPAGLPAPPPGLRQRPFRPREPAAYAATPQPRQACSCACGERFPAARSPPLSPRTAG